MSQPRSICLIDASSIIHRAFHAIPNLSTREGFPTGAVFGFVRMLLKVLKERECDQVAVVYDSKGPTFRHGIDPNYKANRPPMDEDLAVQIPVIKEIVGALGLAGLERQGFEADDIIAALVKEAGKDGREAIIVSGDKDLMQLLGPGISMWDTMKDKTYGVDDVRERFGVGPGRLPDVFGLMGDSVDNIPGVPGIGPKIAGQLIQEYGDLETLLGRASEIRQPKRRQNLIDFADRARLSKTLFILDGEMDMSGLREGLTPGEPDSSRLKELLTGLEMAVLAAELGGEDRSVEALEVVKTKDPDGFLRKIREKGRAALCLTLSGQRPTRDPIVSLDLALGDEVFSLTGGPDSWPQGVKDLLADSETTKVGFNLKQAWVALNRAGEELRGRLFDPFVADYLLQPGRRSSEPGALAGDYLAPGWKIEGPAKEAATAWRMLEPLNQRLEEASLGSVLEEIEIPLLPVLAKMESTGVALDRAALEEFSQDLGQRLEELHKAIMEAAGHEFNPNSPKQLGQVLFDELGLPQGKKTAKTKGYSTGVSVLEGLKGLHPLPGLILEHRGLSKLKSTYADALLDLADPATGRIHTTFNQTVAATGRLSSSDPNLQNIPIKTEEGRRIRKAFVPGPGRVLLSADYSQIELRMLAHYSEDPALIQAFRDGRDIHTETAVRVFEVMPGMVDAELRRQAKIVNFSLIYGKTPYGLSQDLGISTAQAAKFIEAYFQRFSGFKNFHDQALKEARQNGFVTTLWGRRRFIPEINSSNRMSRQAGERMAINTIFQGSAADLIKVAMIRLDKALDKEGLSARMLLQVHDELVLEVEEGELERTRELVKETMEQAGALRVPLVVELGWGKNWDEAH